MTTLTTYIYCISPEALQYQLINHLGGKVVGTSRQVLYFLRGSALISKMWGMPPRFKKVGHVSYQVASVCTHKPLWALAQLSKLCDLFQWQTRRCRGCRRYGLPIERVMLLKDCVSVIRFSNTMQCEKSNGGDRVLWGKVRKPLQSVQSNHGQPCPRLWTSLVSSSWIIMLISSI